MQSDSRDGIQIITMCETKNWPRAPAYLNACMAYGKSNEKSKNKRVLVFIGTLEQKGFMWREQKKKIRFDFIGSTEQASRCRIIVMKNGKTTTWRFSINCFENGKMKYVRGNWHRRRAKWPFFFISVLLLEARRPRRECWFYHRFRFEWNRVVVGRYVFSCDPHTGTAIFRIEKTTKRISVELILSLIRAYFSSSFELHSDFVCP